MQWEEAKGLVPFVNSVNLVSARHFKKGPESAPVPYTQLQLELKSSFVTTI